VEIAKSLVGYSAVTGDWFALVAPVGITLGRIGCWLHGCCHGIECPPGWFTVQDATGIARWPSVQLEMLFNLFFLTVVTALRHWKVLLGQHFHLYLIAYGAFRFLHEFLRDEPRVLGPITGYQIAALAVLGLGLRGFVLRQRQNSQAPLIHQFPTCDSGLG